MSHVWVASVYEGLAKDLIERLKFGRSAGASKDIARILDDIVPFLPDDTIITYIPTANSRVRQRGYDQSMLIAKELAKIRNLKLANTLNRLTKTRQLGASRDQRFEQAKKAFEVSSKLEVNGRGFLVVDDVTTSGATLESAAKLLKKAGAKTVDGVVFAQAIE